MASRTYTRDEYEQVVCFGCGRETGTFFSSEADYLCMDCLLDLPGPEESEEGDDDPTD